MSSLQEAVQAFDKALDQLIQKFSPESENEIGNLEKLLEEAEQKNIDDFIKRYRGESSRLDDMLELLIDHEFFVCPAAQKYHGNYIGGLYDHSKQVAIELHKLTVRLGLKWDSPDSPLVIGFLHDLCKLDQYKIVESENCEGYTIEYNKEQLYDGHGEKSLIMALDLGGYLTDEEKACIRYHMGAFTDEKEWKYYTRAIKQYPNVLYTYTADMIASQILNV